VKWNDIAGLGDAKELLRENIALPLALPELFTGIRRPVKVRAAYWGRCTACSVPAIDGSERQGSMYGKKG